MKPLVSCIHFTRASAKLYTFHPSFCEIHPSEDRYASYPGRNGPLLDRFTMYTTPPRFAGMFIRSAAAYLLGKRNESHTTVISPCRTVQNDEISPKQGFGSTGHSRQISTLRSAGSLQSAICAIRMLYYHPGCTNSLLETPPTRSTPLPALLQI